LAARRNIPDEEFIAVYRNLKSAFKVAAHFNLSHPAVWQRRRKIEREHGIVLPQADKRRRYARGEVNHGNTVFNLEVEDGIVLIGSDIHVWPGRLTTMQRAFIQFAKDLKPVAVILNGDVFDGSSISRHPPIGWEHRPTVKQELDAVQDFLGALVIAAGSATRVWTCGNHDSRFSTRIAQSVPELAGVKGVQLKDHFEQWTPIWRVDINDDVVVKHRMAGGEHADWNNVVRGGKTTVTGHDHRLGVVPYHDYRGVRWGVRCGYMGESPLDQQFVNYLESSMPNWMPGFVILTFRDGRLLWPEVVAKFDDENVEFRGEVTPV